jgi:hypothetical protein
MMQWSASVSDDYAAVSLGDLNSVKQIKFHFCYSYTVREAMCSDISFIWSVYSKFMRVFSLKVADNGI